MAYTDKTFKLIYCVMTHVQARDSGGCPLAGRPALSLSEIEVQFRIACVLCLCGKWTVMEDSVSLFS